MIHQVDGKVDEAERCYRKEIAIQPNAQVYSNLGVILEGRDDYVAADKMIRRAIELQPDFPEAHYNLGNLLADQLRFPEAVAAFDRASDLRPGYAAAHVGKALALLTTGDLEHGLREYEWRWQWKESGATMPPLARPMWNGESLDGRTILICCEQGLGDRLQFVRYLRLVKQRSGGRVVFVACPELFCLWPRGN